MTQTLKAKDKIKFTFGANSKADAEIVRIRPEDGKVRAKIHKVNGRRIYGAQSETLTKKDIANITHINGKKV